MKKLISVALALALVLSMAVCAFAAGTYIVAGSSGLCGTNWDPADTSNAMTQDGDVYTITYTNVAVGTYEFKVTDGSWSNSWGDNGGNYKFAVTQVGDITITFNPGTGEITVSGSGVGEATLDVQYIVAVGAGAGNFLNNVHWDPAAEANKMTEADGVYTITYADVAADTYEFKFAANGAWTDDWGTGNVIESGVETEIPYKGGNSQVVVAEDGSTVELKLDLSAIDSKGNGAKVTVNVTAPVAEPATYNLVDGVMQTITIPAGGSANVVVTPMGNDMILAVNGNGMYYDWWFQAGRFPCYPDRLGYAETQLPAGSSYTITIYNTNAEAEQVLDVTASTFVPSVGTWDNPAELVMGENVAEVTADGFFYTWQPTEDGVLTLTIDTEQCNDWVFCCNVYGDQFTYGDNNASDSDPLVSTISVDVFAYDTVEVILGTASYGDATVILNASFVPGGQTGGETGGEGGEGGEPGDESDEQMKEEYVISETVLVIGENAVSMEENAENTLFDFTPDEVGVYTFTAPEGIQLGNWNNSNFPLDMTFDKTNTLQWECTSVGQSILVGVAGSDDTTITVTKEGEGAGEVENEFENYENVHTPNDSNNLTLNDGDELINVDISEAVTVVLGDDGFYHLNDANGPVLYVDLISDVIDLPGAYGAYGAGAMRGDYTDDEGVTHKYEFIGAMESYANVLNEDGLYPLTVDLAIYLQAYGTFQGWYMAGFSPFDAINEGEFDADSAWLVSCYYVESDVVEENPGTSDYTVAGLVVALMAATAGAVVIGKKEF